MKTITKFTMEQLRNHKEEIQTTILDVLQKLANLLDNLDEVNRKNLALCMQSSIYLYKITIQTNSQEALDKLNFLYATLVDLEVEMKSKCCYEEIINILGEDINYILNNSDNSKIKSEIILELNRILIELDKKIVANIFNLSTSEKSNLINQTSMQIKFLRSKMTNIHNMENNSFEGIEEKIQMVGKELIYERIARMTKK